MKKTLPVLLLFFLLALFFYRNTSSAKFTYDFAMLIAHFTDPFGEMLKYTTAGGFMPGYNLLAYFFYEVFGLNKFAWLLTGVLWHSINAWLLFILLRKIISAANINSAYLVSPISALIFLLSPFQTEAVAWGTAINYLFTCSVLLITILLTLHYAITKSVPVLLAIPVLMLAALLTLEAALAFPLVIAAICFLSPKGLLNRAQQKNISLYIILPMLLTIGAYFLIAKAATGSFFTHYNGDPVKWISIPVIAGNCTKYFLKFFAFLPVWGFNIRQTTSQFAQDSVIIHAACILLSLLTAFFIFRSNRLNNNARLILLFFVLAGVSFSPFSTLPYSNIFTISNDRHGYIPSLFFFPLLVMLCVVLLHRYYYIPLAIYLLASVYYLNFYTRSWGHAGDVTESLVKDFRWYDKDKVYIIGMPNRFEGAWMLESYGETFKQTIKAYEGKDLQDKVQEIAQVNMLTPADSIKVNKTSDSTLNVWVASDGTWFSFRSTGGEVYESDDFKVSGNGVYFDFTLKKKKPNTVFIYSSGGKWKEVKM